MTISGALSPIGEVAADIEPAEDDGARTLGDRVYGQLLDAIMTGEIPLGAKIREIELAQRFGVSRGPLREAIRRLEERRIVVRTAHVGARVNELTSQALLELFYVREAMEGMAARLASERMSDREIAELGALLEHHAEVVERSDIYAQPSSDRDFHYLIAKGARNDLIEGLLCRDLYQLLRIYRFKHSAQPGRAQRALLEHQRIAGAIADRDGDLSEILMRRHIRAARLNLEKLINEGRATAAPGTETSGRIT
ncbi:GntR family transcriptional regulator [Acuticoccus sediminis]|uniref:GntR family transcriptional regulator n=1 Tax=Acuticoccus sediminis TaxID=2184697 RepID=UPI001CFE9A6F|nr:GntR family transcriptional regulator [Acuticoccus sediminis]